MPRATSILLVVALLVLAPRVCAEEDVYDYNAISEELPAHSNPRDFVNFPNWLPFHKLLSDEAKRWTQSGDLDLLFLGDSFTETWRGTEGGLRCVRCKAVPEIFAQEYGTVKAAAFGIAADRAAHLLWRLQNGELPQGLKARVVVVLVGSNDLGQNGPGTAEETTKGIRAIVDYVREVIPEAQVVPMAILPRGRITHHGQATILPIRTNITLVNNNLRELWGNQTDPKISFLDCNSKFVDAAHRVFVDRHLMPDYFHLNELGYQKWADCLNPVIAKWLPGLTSTNAASSLAEGGGASESDSHSGAEREEL